MRDDRWWLAGVLCCVTRVAAARVAAAVRARDCESPVQVCNLEFVHGLRIVVTDSVRVNARLPVE
jgi:hypothetical protein